MHFLSGSLLLQQDVFSKNSNKIVLSFVEYGLPFLERQPAEKNRDSIERFPIFLAKDGHRYFILAAEALLQLLADGLGYFFIGEVNIYAFFYSLDSGYGHCGFSETLENKLLHCRQDIPQLQNGFIVQWMLADKGADHSRKKRKMVFK